MLCESDLSLSQMVGFTYSRSHVSFEIINCTDERNRFYSLFLSLYTNTLITLLNYFIKPEFVVSGGET